MVAAIGIAGSTLPLAAIMLCAAICARYRLLKARTKQLKALRRRFLSKIAAFNARAPPDPAAAAHAAAV